MKRETNAGPANSYAYECREVQRRLDYIRTHLQTFLLHRFHPIRQLRNSKQVLSLPHAHIACYSVVAATHGGREGHNNAIPTTVSALRSFTAVDFMFDVRRERVAIQVCSLVARVETSVSTYMFRQTRWVSTYDVCIISMYVLRISCRGASCGCGNYNAVQDSEGVSSSPPNDNPRGSPQKHESPPRK